MGRNAPLERRGGHPLDQAAQQKDAGRGQCGGGEEGNIRRQKEKDRQENDGHRNIKFLRKEIDGDLGGQSDQEGAGHPWAADQTGSMLHNRTPATNLNQIHWIKWTKQESV